MHKWAHCIVAVASITATAVCLQNQFIRYGWTGGMFEYPVEEGPSPMLTAEEIQLDCEERMQKAIGSVQNELATIRTGRANPQILDRVLVDYYGTPTPVRQMANISVQEGTTLVIQPYDKTQLAEIEKSIAKSELGLNPNSDGDVIRISIPPLTEERRKEIAKLVKKIGEEGKVAVRNVRRDCSDDLKKSDDLTEDQLRGELEDIQTLTDKYVAQIDTVVKEKETEVLTV